MKKILFLFLIITSIQCSSDGFNNHNPYLPNYSFSYDVNLNLPTNSSLNFAGNGVAILLPGIGVRGIIVFNTGGGFSAYDAACPNQPLADCSTLTLNGSNAVCPCDDESYNLFTGLGSLQYPLKRYRVEIIGNIVRVYN